MTISLPQNVQVNEVSARVSGTDVSNEPSSVVANKLVDTANNFTSVAIGDVVVLIDTPGTFTTVTALDSTTELSLAKDIIKSTDDNYFVLTAADAFKIVQNGTLLNFLQLFSVGSAVDFNDGEVITKTLSGCLVTSVDSSTQLTTDLPMGGYGEEVFITTKNKIFFNVEALDVFYADTGNEEIALTGYAFDNMNYASVYSDTMPSSLEDIAEAVSEAVGGGYRNNAPINTRTLGATAAFNM